jgi:glycosyltransferase involved in cell wall biosynthesis
LNGFVVAFSGRRTRSKGYFDLLKAIHLARRAGADVRLMTMGDISPTEAAEVEGLVRELGLIGSLVDLGHRKDSDLILEAADAFALPSYHEGLPLGILEALATPLPVVASNVGGIPEVIEDGKQGLLFRPGDVEGLAERLLRLARDPALSKALAENARERVKDFSLARTVDAYARMYENASRNSIRSSRTRRAGGSR